MNRIYKVIWNEALNCFTAVGEYAKGRGKSSKSSVSSNATINTTSNASSINRLRLSAIGIGLIAAGFTMSPQVFAATGVGGGVEIGTASNCSTAASAGKTDSVAVGCNSVADLSSDLAVTFYQRNNPDNTGVDTSTAFNSTAIGTGAVATEAGTSLGMNASSSNLGIALGIQSKSENVAAIAIGPAALAKGNTSLALGRQSAATEDFAQAIGNVSSATGKGSLAMGHSARAEGYRSIAIGSADINGADATGTQSGVVYQTNEQTLAKGKDSMAFGSGAQSLLEDSVALGSNSTANVGGNVGGYVPTGVNGTAILATKSTTGAVSVGRVASGNEAAVRRQIVNLAAGTNDSDAVNVAQLKGGISSVIDLGLDFTGDNTATTVTRNLGEKLTVKGGATTVLSDNNIGVVADNMSNTLTIKLAKNLTGLDSADIGGINVSSTGIDANSTRITNVASGVGDDYNAANIGDLNKAVADNKTKYYSVKSGATGNKNNDGAQGPNSMAMGGNASATGGQAIAIGSGESGQNTVASGQQSIAIGANTVSKGHSSIAIGGDDLDAASMVSGVNALFNTYTGSTGGLVTVGDYSNHTESGGAASVAIGVKALSKGHLSTAVGVQSSSDGVASSAFGMGSSASKDGSVALGAGSTTLNDATYQEKLTIGNKDYNYAGATNDKGAQVSVGSEERERQIKHVASGEVSATSTDGINGSQLHATNESVKDLTTTVVANKTHFYSVNSTDSTRGNYNNDGAAGVDAMAAGIDALATGENATALGTKSNAEGTRSTAIGYQAQAKDRNAIALGYQANAHQKHSTAIGYAANAGYAAIAIGDAATATKKGSTAIGSQSVSTDVYSTALGREAKALEKNTVAVGYSTTASGESSVAIGDGAKASGVNSIAIGTGNIVNGDNSGAFGDPNIISGSGSYAVGNNNTIDADNSFVLGNNVTINASDEYSIALGEGAVINGEDSIAIGRGATAAASTRNGLAIGVRSSSGNHAASLGDDATSGNYAVALGSKSTAQIGGTAIGRDSSAVSNATALGREAIAGQSGNVALGHQSVTAAQHTGAFAINNQPVAGLTSGAKTVSVGSAGAERQIQNVAPGVVDATSTDAINGSQLFATNEAIDDLSGTVVANKTKYYSVKSGATGNKNNDGAQGPNSMAMGGNASATGGQAIAIGSGESGQNTVASGQQSIAIGANVVSSGNSSIAIGGDDLDAASKVSGVNALFDTYTGSTGGLVTVGDYSNHTESNGAASVAIGVKAQSSGNLSTAVGVRSSSSGDASSAFGMGSSATKKGSVALGAGSVANRAGGLAGYIPTGVSLADADAITNTQSGAISGAVSVGSGAKGGNRQIINLAAGTNDSDAVNVAQLKGGISSVIDLGLDFTGDTGTATRKLGQTLSITGGATSDLTTANIGVEADETGGLVVKLAEKVNLGADGSVTTGNTLVNNDGLTVAGGPSFTTSGIDAGDQQIKGVLSGGLLTDVNNELNAANIGDIKTAIGDVTTLGFGIKAADNNEVQKNLGQTVDIIGSNSNLTTQIDNGKVEVVLNNNLDLDTNGSIKMGSSSSLPPGLGPVTNVNRFGMTTGNALAGTSINLTGVTVASPLGITNLNSTGLYVVGGPSVTTNGINAGNRKIVNVDDGSNDKDAVNFGQLKNFSAAARTKVVKGSNVDSVDFSIDSNTGQDVYTVNADGVSVSSADVNALTVTPSTKDTTTNITDYQVDLGDKTKTSLSLADSAMQTLITQVDGVDHKTLTSTDNKANFASGDNILLTPEMDGSIKVATKDNVEFKKVTVKDGADSSVVEATKITVGGSSPVTINGATGTINGLTNKTWDGTSIVSGQAATEDQLKLASTALVNKGMKFVGNDGQVISRMLGETLGVEGGMTTGASSAANTKTVKKDNGTLEIQMAKNLTDLDSIMINNGGPIISSTGIDMGSNADEEDYPTNTITNLGKGVNGTDAVNLDQLNDVTTDLTDLGFDITADNASLAPSETKDKVKLGETVKYTSADGSIVT
ncbi:ESPR-type extended signal peptide-containing protein, partial [Psychrobacter pacificensis]|uniref:ESPR-type extended signal peptide-containing protein n=1 Tax=Psychrobacter pacificensis TaxID=112002 RepID=UPI003D0711CF